MSMRRCEIVQQADRLTEEQIIEGLKNRRSIKWYAYVLHDSDTYTKEDEASNPEHKPTINVSALKIEVIFFLDAPIALSTPISFVRSNTEM